MDIHIEYVEAGTVFFVTLAGYCVPKIIKDILAFEKVYLVVLHF